jgi:hypothetical protein
MCSSSSWLTWATRSAPPFTAVWQAMNVLVSHEDEFPDKSLLLTRLILRTPAVRGRYLEDQARWRDGLTAGLAERTGADPSTDLRPAMTASIGLAAFDVALGRWVDSDGKLTLPDCLGAAFTAAQAVVDDSGTRWS